MQFADDVEGQFRQRFGWKRYGFTRGVAGESSHLADVMHEVQLMRKLLTSWSPGALTVSLFHRSDAAVALMREV